MLKECDFVLVTVPLTPDTRGMIGPKEIAAMKPTALLLNVLVALIGTARFASALRVADFQKHVHVVYADETAFGRVADAQSAGVARGQSRPLSGLLQAAWGEGADGIGRKSFRGTAGGGCSSQARQRAEQLMARLVTLVTPQEVAEAVLGDAGRFYHCIVAEMLAFYDALRRHLRTVDDFESGTRAAACGGTTAIVDYATPGRGEPLPDALDAWMALAVERIFLPAAKLTIPELVDFHLPPEGVAHNLMILSIRKSYPGQARKVMNAIWSLGQAMFTKCIIVVDEDVNVQDIGDVTLKVLNHIDPERDIQFTLGPVDSLDHASRLPDYGSKMGIDATRKWPSEGFARPWPDEIVMDAKTRALVDGKWKALAKELGIE